MFVYPINKPDDARSHRSADLSVFHGVEDDAALNESATSVIGATSLFSFITDDLRGGERKSKEERRTLNG